MANGLQQAWKRPMHWAGFLVMGANTCLPRGGLGRQKKAEEWRVAEVCEMVREIGFADAAKILEENALMERHCAQRTLTASSPWTLATV